MAENTGTMPQEQGFLSGVMQDNPLAVGLVALVLGALVGLLLPETRQENALMGNKRDQLAHQAQDSVKQLAQKATVVAKTAQDAAQDALAKTQDAAMGAVKEAVATVKEEAQNQGVPVGAA
jgi:gas vesicle protein